MKNLDTQISEDDLMCHKMHYDCVFNMVQNKCITKDTIICHDDIMDQYASKGKGVLSIPFLVKNGLKILTYQGNGMVLKIVD